MVDWGDPKKGAAAGPIPLDARVIRMSWRASFEL